MKFGRITRIHVDRREHVVLTKICRCVVLEPPAEELTDFGILPRHAGDLHCAVSERDEAQGVRLHEAVPLGENILPGIVVLEGPLRKDRPHLLVRDPAALAFCGLENGFGAGHRLLPLPMHLQGLAIFPVIPKVLLVQAQPLRDHLRALCQGSPADALRHCPLKVRGIFGQDLRQVEGRGPERWAHNSQHPMLKVEKEILPLRAHLQRLAQCLGVPVAFVPVIGLRWVPLPVLAVGDGRFLAPERCCIISRVLVDRGHALPTQAAALTRCPAQSC
mmetsp:Transcript_94462/g.281980  ORF Transcript_94462/g.281980 Transcript_94462/m.281980 type:complete len:275 (-) Transcript_94462:2-826(-)